MSKPDAYALRNSQGFWVGIWVGIWSKRDIAEHVQSKLFGNEEIVDVRIQRPILPNMAERQDYKPILENIHTCADTDCIHQCQDGNFLASHLLAAGEEVIELRELVTDLTAALEASTKELIGERDCLYESHAQPDTGEVTDDEGKQGLAELDAIIDRNQAVIKKAKGDNCGTRNSK